MSGGRAVAARAGSGPPVSERPRPRARVRRRNRLPSSPDSSLDSTVACRAPGRRCPPARLRPVDGRDGQLLRHDLVESGGVEVAADGERAASGTASPARASSPRSASGGTAGPSNGPWPGSSAVADSTAAMNARPSVFSPSPASSAPSSATTGSPIEMSSWAGGCLRAVVQSGSGGQALRNRWCYPGMVITTDRVVRTSVEDSFQGRVHAEGAQHAGPLRFSRYRLLRDYFTST